MCLPRHRGFTPSKIPVIRGRSGATIKIICGRIVDTVGPVNDIGTDPEYLDTLAVGG